ncbi:hypothetical protein [Alkaliphilus sp. B6464]|uniref:hypothetical protein n=1 Tax=Alkaliphilus sp. B6464 TaxID=2731219 RepID=UPI001BA80E7A|nr:hypothetical protein [Alkaliphilus sp. B6464]QUH21864.1 hypothetical protein HYG84_18175 [Alkaliphilus sp. B6464]
MKIKLYKEQEVKEIYDFKGIKEFLRTDLEITRDLGFENPFIKGCLRSGKTSKVLIPLYKVWEGGKLYINIERRYEDVIVDRDDIHVFGLHEDKPNFSDITSLLLTGKSVYLSLSAESAQKMKLAYELLNDIFADLHSKVGKVDVPILICCDELHHLGRIENLVTVLEDNNLYVASTVQYTRQLESNYTSEEVQKIKKFITMYDVEKQPKNHLQ